MDQRDTDKIGEGLQREYSGKDPDTPIVHFYIRLGQDIVKHLNHEKVITELQAVLGLNTLIKAEPGWDGLLLFKYSGREEDINQHIKLPLMTRLSNYGSSSTVHILFTRACLYTENSKDDSTSISIDEIERITTTYKQTPPQLEYFYLFIQAEVSGKHFFQVPAGETTISIADLAQAELKTLPGEWRVVKPQDTWPGIVFGFYPKGLRVLTEREREKRLNGEVRIPLIEKLEEKLAPITGRGEVKPMVHIIITRAC